MQRKKCQIPRKNLELVRVRAIKAHNAGARTSDIAKLLGIHPNSVSRWIGVYKAGGARALRENKSSGRPRKIDCKDLAPKIFKLLKQPATTFGFDSPLWNSPRLTKVIHENLDVKISTTTLLRRLREIGLSYQKPEKIAFEQDPKARAEWLNKTWPALKDMAKKERAVILFEDEASVSLNPTVGKTWAKISRTPSIRTSSSRGSISIMSAISPSGRLYFTLPKGNINSDAFIKFTKQILNEIPRKKIYMVVDNCSSHRSKKTSDFIRESGRIKLCFLPSYSPDFNPDELTWATLKRVKLAAHQERNKPGLRKKTLGKMRSIQKNKEMIKSFVKSVYQT